MGHAMAVHVKTQKTKLSKLQSHIPMSNVLETAKTVMHLLGPGVHCVPAPRAQEAPARDHNYSTSGRKLWQMLLQIWRATRRAAVS